MSIAVSCPRCHAAVTSLRHDCDGTLYPHRARLRAVTAPAGCAYCTDRAPCNAHRCRTCRAGRVPPASDWRNARGERVCYVCSARGVGREREPCLG